MAEENKKENIDSTNIFDEFSQDEDLKSKVDSTQKKKERGVYYYLGVLSSLFKFMNIILLLTFILIGSYIYIQNSDEFSDITYLKPICPILLDESVIDDSINCSSVTSSITKYKDMNINMSDSYYKDIINVIEDVYYVSNFAFSKDILFLLDRTQNRLNPLKILEEFDRLKNEFEPINKGKLLCKNLEISGEGELSMTCEAYSSRWDRNIVGLSGKNQRSENVSGTSISIASSFINYLEKNSKDFILIDKQKEFKYNDVADYGGYSRKTSFKIILKLRSNNLSLK